jgi:predicted kinase
MKTVPTKTIQTASKPNRPILYFTYGLPASGKTNWATEKAWLTGAIRLNKDDIRNMFSRNWTKGGESVVLAGRDSMIESALTQGKNVIVDDTNLAPKHEDAFRALAKKCDAHLVKADFTGVPMEECIDRDAARTDKMPVGAKVIEDMARRFGMVAAPTTQSRRRSSMTR